MFYLPPCSRSLFKSYNFYGLFLPLEKHFKCYEKCFQFYLYVFLKKKCPCQQIQETNVLQENQIVMTIGDSL